MHRSLSHLDYFVVFDNIDQIVIVVGFVVIVDSHLEGGPVESSLVMSGI